MAKIEFREGIQCKKCGDIIAYVYMFTPDLCQCCGARIIDKNNANKSYKADKDGKDVVVKVTHKFFKDTYEVV